jgi:hypothetical protein
MNALHISSITFCHDTALQKITLRLAKIIIRKTKLST